MGKVIITERQLNKIINLFEDTNLAGDKVSDFDKDLEGKLVYRWGRNRPAHVKLIQKMLIELGKDLGTNGDPPGVDGQYGPLTTKAVEEFQEETFPDDENEWDGVVGPITYEALINAIAEKTGSLSTNVWQKIKDTFTNKKVEDEEEVEDVEDEDIEDDDEDIKNIELTIDNPVEILGGGYPTNNVRQVEKAMDAAGITNPYARIAIFGVIGKESGFKPIREKPWGGTANSRIREYFSVFDKAGITDEELDIIKKDPKKFFGIVYGPLAFEHGAHTWAKKHHTKPEDGYNYRGRGFNQLTWKPSYKSAGDAIGVDLVNDPNLIMDPEVAGAVAINFLSKRLKRQGIDPQSFESQEEANKYLAWANAGWGNKESSKKLQRAISNTNDHAKYFAYPEEVIV